MWSYFYAHFWQKGLKMNCEHEKKGLRERCPVIWENGDVSCRECAETYSDEIIDFGIYLDQGVKGRLI